MGILGLRTVERRVFWRALVLLACTVFLLVRALYENDVATRQETTTGFVADCKKSLHGTNYCVYEFSTDAGEQYRGRSEAYSTTAFGQTATVYYDPENPGANSLKDFSKASHADALLGGAAGLVFLAVVVYAAFSKPVQVDSERPQVS